MSIEVIKSSSANLVGGAVKFLNQPVVKETVKKCVGVANSIFGFLAIYDIFLRLREGLYTDPKVTKNQKWLRLAIRVSTIGLALSTFPGSIYTGRMMTSLVGEDRLNQTFGSNTNFATNPLHPRHVISIASTLIGTIALVKCLYDRFRPLTKGEERDIVPIPPAFVILLVLSRPSLHLGNALLANFR